MKRPNQTPEHKLCKQTLEQRSRVIDRHHPIQAKIQEAIRLLLEFEDDAVPYADRTLKQAAEPYARAIEKRYIEEERAQAVRRYNKAQEEMNKALEELARIDKKQ